jgi:hypothetical protein|tara:strand:+ start:149 stop:292 length:144 start_codon:yes stop_codon:yes gene_type:complete
MNEYWSGFAAGAGATVAVLAGTIFYWLFGAVKKGMGAMSNESDIRKP